MFLRNVSLISTAVRTSNPTKSDSFRCLNISVQATELVISAFRGGGRSGT
jgi:hypothetical protein